MDYKKKKKLLSLKNDILNNFYNSKLFNEHLEIETIDYIIATIYSFNIVFPGVSEYLKEEDERKYHKFNYIDKQRKKLLTAALELKKEIARTTCNNEYFLRNSHRLKKYEIVYGNEDDIKFIKNKFENILYLIKRLMKLLENYDIKGLEPFYMLIKRISNCYNVIYYSYHKRDKKTIKQDDNINKLIEEVIEYEPEENYWIINIELKFEDDIDIIDDIYIDIFGDEENKNESESLIGIIVSDFYEYYKSDKNLYIDDEYSDILDLLEYIEENSLETITNQFKNDPLWAYFILDSYIYYNMYYPPYKKLENRQKIKNMDKLDVLKKLNIFINDTLVDETLNNINILTLSDIIRISNGNLFDELDKIDDIPTEDLLLKYFTSNFTPDMDNIIPIEIKDININTLKHLQLRFIISDIFSRELCNGNKTTNELLDKKPDELYNLIISNPVLLKKYLKQYIYEIDNYKSLELSKTQKEKIIRFNKLAALDDI